MPQKTHAAKAAFLFPPKAARFSSEVLNKRLVTLGNLGTSSSSLSGLGTKKSYYVTRTSRNQRVFKSWEKNLALETLYIKVFPDMRKNILPGDGRIWRSTNYCFIAYLA